MYPQNSNNTQTPQVPLKTSSTRIFQLIPEENRLKIIIVIIITFLVTILIVSLINLISRSGKIKVSIQYTPTNAVVFLDNSNQNINGKEIYITEGDHKLLIFNNGYLQQEQSININQYNLSFAGSLIPINATNIEIDDIQEELATTEKILDAESNQKLINKYPLIAYLPYSTRTDSFNITYEFNSNYTELKINITPKKVDDFIALNSACNILKNFDPSVSVVNYNIIIDNFTNVFKNKFQNNNQSNPLTFLQEGFKSVPNINIKNGIEKDSYYYTTIEYNFEIDSESTDYVPYHLILKKQGNSWVLVSTPTLILTTYNTPNVPEEILNLANNY